MNNAWVVMKFGGTSVTSAARWDRIADRIRERTAEGVRPLVVHSALAGVSDELERLIQAPSEDRVARIRDRHEALARETGVRPDLDEWLDELDRLAAGIRLLGEASPTVRARVLATGELMATRLGASILRDRGLDVTWMDARQLLDAEPAPPERATAGILSATCDASPDPVLVRRLAEAPGVVVTQGFIASGPDGGTVLLGRGGSDTSAAYLAARLSAQRLEIWTDVPGMFSADPRSVPSARLLRSLDYSEAQELASTGSRVLHPRCIAPVRRAGIPLHVRSTELPDVPGTVIGPAAGSDAPQLKAISTRPDVTLVSMETMGMWQEVGFLARAFGRFAAHGFSIDLVSTSESNVTVSIDGEALDPGALDRLVSDLQTFCRVQVIDGCAAVSLIGRGIRTILHELGPALEVFEHHRIHLMSQAANDLNLTAVVDTDQSARLVGRLHELIETHHATGPIFGPRWDELVGAPASGDPVAERWWTRRRPELLALADRTPSAYVYDLETVSVQLRGLMGLDSVDRVLYAMKANANDGVLERIHAEGAGFECVSIGELERTRALGVAPERVLFTPNFAPRAEYEAAFEMGVNVTLDNLHPLRHWPDVFRGRELFVRLDPGRGEGHHEHVRTAGRGSKFGIPESELGELRDRVRTVDAQVVGLHAHSGSGVFDPENWRRTGAFLADIATGFSGVRVLDLGGGLGVPERPGERPLDLEALENVLSDLRKAHPDREIWMEPGRYVVAEAGVLISRVTQIKAKGPTRYVGVSTGMNSLIRPALYGAFHEIVNLSRLGEPATERVTVVGPNCETGDRLGRDRWLPETSEGDVLLIATAGAYGAVMSSHYNQRPPAPEFALA